MDNSKYIVGVLFVILFVLAATVLVWSERSSRAITQPTTTETPVETATTTPFNTTNATTTGLVKFAQCLAAKKITMYGAVWCAHCINQKKEFGDAWKYVPYVECPDNIKLCLAKGVTGYPTWIKADGQSISGEQSLEDLSKWSQCPLK